MERSDIARLKADASGNTALSEVLGEAVKDFSHPQDAVRFLAERGFAVTCNELQAAAAEDAAPEGGYGALLRFVRRR